MCIKDADWVLANAYGGNVERQALQDAFHTHGFGEDPEEYWISAHSTNALYNLGNAESACARVLVRP